MTTKKKLILIASILSVAVVLAVTTMIVVLVTARQNATSTVRVRFTAVDVNVRLSGNTIVGVNTTAMENESGYTEIELGPDHLSDELSPAQVSLDYRHQQVVYEYKFINQTNLTGVEISLDTTTTTKTNLSLQYYVSDTKVSNISSVTLLNNFAGASISSGVGSTKYVYVVVSVDDISQAAELDAEFTWLLERPTV